MAARLPGAAGLPAAPALRKRVLFLNSYGYGRIGVEDFTRAYVETMAAAGVSSEDVVVEYLNLNRADAPAQRSGLRDLLRQQYNQHNVDLIVALQQPALDYLLTELPQLARAVPVLAVTPGTDPLPAPAGGRIVQHSTLPDVEGTLDQALALFPGTKRVVVAVGAGAPGQAMKRQFQDLASYRRRPLVFEFLDQLSLADMRRRVAQLPPRTILICGTVNRDKDGALATPIQFADELARLANGPAFGLYSTSLGHGMVGGSMVDLPREAQRLAVTSLQLLNGSVSAAALRPLEPRYAPMYDWLQLQRWHADLAGLLPQALLINRPATLWQQRPATVLATVAAFVVLTLLLLVLLDQRRRLLRARAAARDSEQRVRTLVEHAPEAILVLDVDIGLFVDANSNAEHLLRCSREVLLRSGPAAFISPQQPADLPPQRDQLADIRTLMAGAVLLYLQQLRRADGTTLVAEVRLVRLPAHGRKLLRCGLSDVTLARAFEQERAEYRGQLEQQVQQRTAALSQALTEAQSANRAKGVFLSNMGHELRTPLNAVIGFSQLMAGAPHLTADDERNLGLIHRAGSQLLSMINDILHLARIDAGRVVPQPATVLLRPLLDDVLAELAGPAGAAGIGLRLDCQGVPEQVRLDAPTVHLVLHHLLSNGIKFAGRGSVTLRVRGVDQGQHWSVAFAVIDHGAGIAVADQDRVFEPFVQLHSSGASDGAGLGLTIARQCVALLGGTLTLESAPQRGCVFRFSLAAQGSGSAPPARPLPVSPVVAVAGAAAPAPALVAADLASLPSPARLALLAALRELDLARVTQLLAALPPAHGPTVARIEHLLLQHRYPQLCSLFEGIANEKNDAY